MRDQVFKAQLEPQPPSVASQQCFPATTEAPQKRIPSASLEALGILLIQIVRLGQCLRDSHWPAVTTTQSQTVADPGVPISGVVHAPAMALLDAHQLALSLFDSLKGSEAVPMLNCIDTPSEKGQSDS